MLIQEDIDHVLKPNTEAPMLLQAELLAEKKLQKGASVVFIASAAATMPVAGNAVYSASKAAMVAYAKCLAQELAPRQIRVNSISPAMVWTDLALVGATAEQLTEAEKQYPLKRYGKPEDIAHLAVYMLSDASQWMTGSDVQITGGSQVL
jgi:NAD(P)-dependent dehydrogenase (short-subunit alcohol dehydrogenase family)